MNTPGELFTELLDIMRRLRSKEGCPWDRRQTPRTLKPYLLEETYELLEALDSSEHSEIREEIGDLMFMLVFISRIHEENGAFTIDEVLREIIAKMIRRHPHVFEKDSEYAPEEIRLQWQVIKDEEKKHKAGAQENIFSSVPRTLPALVRAQQISKRAARTGFEWRSFSQALTKLEEEIAELREAAASGEKNRIQEEMGDVFFVLVNLCRLSAVDAEDSLTAATRKFIRRFSRLSHIVKAEGTEIANLDQEELLTCWRKIKREEP